MIAMVRSRIVAMTLVRAAPLLQARPRLATGEFLLAGLCHNLLLLSPCPDPSPGNLSAGGVSMPVNYPQPCEPASTRPEPAL